MYQVLPLESSHVSRHVINGYQHMYHGYQHSSLRIIININVSLYSGKDRFHKYHSHTFGYRVKDVDIQVYPTY